MSTAGSEIQPRMSPSLMRSGSRGPTAAETVAALKAGMGALDLPSMAAGGAGPRSGGSLIGGRPPMAPWSQASISPQFARFEQDEEPQEILDPRRNDDLPPRPTTSRGRPSSSYNINSDTGGAQDHTAAADVPPPSMILGGSGAEVLNIMQAESDGDSTDDESYRHLYTYNNPRTPEELARDPLQWPGGVMGGGPAPYVSSPKAAHSQGSSSSGRSAFPSSSSSRSATPNAAAVLDPNDPVVAWRQAVEETLCQMAASTSAFATATGSSQKEAMTDLLRHTTTLGSHVEHMRKQPNSSRWLNVASTSYRDGAGQSLIMREVIAEHAYQLMDSTNPELLIKGCGVILRVVKSRQPLLQASKLLYRLSKDTANDTVFRREKLLEPLIRTVSVMVATSNSSGSGGGGGGSISGPSSMHEPLVYLNGCLKNITNDASNQRGLVKLGALQVLGSLLTLMASQMESSRAGLAAAEGSASHTTSETPSAANLPAQVSVQVTGVLRNLAISPSHAAAFVSSGVLRALRVTAEAVSGSSTAAPSSSGGPGKGGRATQQQEEVLLNVGRILSKLSLHEECQAAIEADARFAPLLMSLLSQYSEHRAILLRVAFVMGNLTTNSDVYREQITNVPGSVATIVSILERYSSQCTAPSVASSGPASSGPQGEDQEGGGSSTTHKSASAVLSRAAHLEDCIIKLLRLVANLAIHPEVGPRIASQPAVTASLVALLSSHNFSESEELVLNCICALTNLSYYHREDNQVLACDPASLLCHVTPLLMSDNEEAAVEAARAYGNFSRVPLAREYMQEARVLEAMLLLLDHNNHELLYSICGTLINFTVDSDRKEALVDMGGVSRLLDVLERIATTANASEIEVSILLAVFKALFNVCADDCVAGEPLPLRPAVTEDEVTTLEAIIEHIRGSEDFADQDDLVQMSERLLGQVLQISGKYEARNLEELPQ